MAVALLISGCGPVAGGGGSDGVIRVATFNIEELSAEKVDSVGPDGRGAHPQVRAAAEVIRRVRPDVLVLNEVDLARSGYGIDRQDPGRVVRAFQERYLEDGEDPVRYPYLFIAPSNTGILTGLDLNRDGIVATPADEGTRIHGEDSFGFGLYPGQYAMAVLSRHPFDTAGARTFQHLLWRDLPGDHLPRDFYGDSALAVLRLSSKSHWDVPVVLPGGDTLRLLVSHPTPPVFDGPEDRNGRRNLDEIRFWALYLDDEATANEEGPGLYDDSGRRGGYLSGAPFVIAGDLNADPSEGDAVVGGVPSIAHLLDHPEVQDPPTLQDRPTASFGGGMRVDYLLPRKDVEVVDGGVFGHPEDGEPDGADLAERASDHRMVWLDLRLPRL